jgi:prevent-host-death family protein
VTFAVVDLPPVLSAPIRVIRGLNLRGSKQPQGRQNVVGRLVGSLTRRLADVPTCPFAAWVLCNSTVKVTANTLTVSKAQAGLPKLCNSGKSFLITNRDKPTAVLLPIADYEALIETMDLLGNPRAMKALRAAQAGKATYHELDLDDENFGC